MLNFLIATNNFSDDFLKENKGNNMEFMKCREDTTTVDDSTVYKAIDTIKSYINYREDIGFKINPDTINIYWNGLESLQKNLKVNSNVRDLPSNKDALTFGYYVNTFFYDRAILQELKTYYMPILLWWKISNVILIRPTEITAKMERDCLIEDGDRFYLKVNRIKHSNVVKNAVKRTYLLILDKLEITRNIYDLIDNYKNLTNGYGNSQTLFSYKATFELRKYLINLDENKYSFLGDKKMVNNEFSKNLKSNPEYFTIITLDSMLRSFYKHIIKGYYKDNSIECCVNLHDTRHFAFTSLMLQGLTPVEIAIIGGHRRVFSQDSYQSKVSYYVDSEIVNFISARRLGVDFSNKSIKEIIFSKPVECFKPLEQCRKADDDIGYCTVDIKSNGMLCENEEFCFKCSKWWCSPTEDNYDLMRKYIKEKCISPLMKKLAVEEGCLNEIINQMNPVDLDGVLRSNVDEDREFKTLTMDIRRDTHNLLDLKKVLLDLVPPKEVKKIEE
ncbi:hypothetical protein [Clostridium ljungdahlii]|uniref:Uncharacterized protein n=1 Tax=Clostridium ljungdahlii TaxID=1538 RepID=A0A168RBC8_9CLOT|nr:hypothetical protein [Clostridium ljungdahlii]OAA90487.1 hypothetical protein WY13_01391 [Clostridium ljungdahlii]